jgi:hypothetical protein
MKTIEVPKPSFGGAGAAPFSNYPSSGTARGVAPAPFSSNTPKPMASSGSSFLDEWLAKRRTGGSSPPPSPSAAPNVPAFQPQPAFSGSAAPALHPYQPLANNPQQPPLTQQPDPQPAIPQVPQTTGELKIPKPHEDQSMATSHQQEDTIYIDREGNLQTSSDSHTN